MLLEFTIGNYLSFQKKKTLSLIASSISDYKESNIVNTNRHTLLKGTVIYGANASGKSNLIRAMSTMKRIITFFHRSSIKPLNITPFLLNVENEVQPSFFEVLFEIAGIRYRYGFEVTNVEVVAEWLFESKKNTEKLLFIRQRDGIEVSNTYTEGLNLEEKTRNNALFLSVVDQFNGAIANRIMRWFDNFVTISGLSHEDYELETFNILSDKKTGKPLIDFYEKLDLGFSGLIINKKELDLNDIPEDIPEPLFKFILKDMEGAFKFDIKTLHDKFDRDNNKVENPVEFDMRSQESAGTNKIFNISGQIFNVLQNGGVLVIDEFDSSLHPLLTLAITKLFNSQKDNPNNAQLIFTTHDTNLFTYGNYRRDQIFFIEKDQYGASDLYSLVEYREESGDKVRKDRSFEKDYIQGRYGAIPYIGNISKLIKEWQER
jgi:AAA15 family ATPase/GTPase